MGPDRPTETERSTFTTRITSITFLSENWPTREEWIIQRELWGEKRRGITEVIDDSDAQ